MQSCRWANSAKNTDIHLSGPVVRNHIFLNGRKIHCDTENNVPIVVPEISTGFSSLTASTPPTSSPQDSTEDSSSSPATT